MGLSKTFAFSLENKYNTPKTVCLFAGTLPTDALVTDEATDTMVLTHGNPLPVKTYSQSTVDAVLVDGILPVSANGKSLTIPNTEGAGAEYLEARSTSSTFTIDALKSWLKSNFYLVKSIVIKVSDQDQFDNSMMVKTSSPTQQLESREILLTKYNTPNMLQTNKIVISDLTGTVLQDDTMIFWTINANTKVNITFEFEESQA